MSKSEKRYFKLSAVNKKEDAKYVLLFDAIDKQQVYDEAAIKTLFAGQAFIRQLHVTKIYLSDLILRSLRNYHSGNSVSSTLLSLLADIEILFSKELYDSCAQKIDKAEALAKRYEKEALLVEILDRKRRLLIARSISDRKEIAELLQAEKDAVEKMGELHHYWNTTLNFFSIKADAPFLKTLKGGKPATLRAKTLRHHQLYSYYFINGQSQKAEQEITALISLLERHPERIEDDPSPYVTAVGNKISMLFGGKRYAEMLPMIQLMRGVPEKYKLAAGSKFTIRLWLRIFNLELELYRDTLDHKKGATVALEVEAFVAAHSHAIPADYRLMLCFQVAGIYFAGNNLAKSLQHVNDIMNANFGEVRNELQCYARIMNLMIHYELDNILVLRYAVDSARRFLKKKRFHGAAEQGVLQLFSRLGKAAPHEHKSIFIHAFNELEALAKSEKENLQDHTGIQQWIENKMQGRRGKR